MILQVPTPYVIGLKLIARLVLFIKYIWGIASFLIGSVTHGSGVLFFNSVMFVLSQNLKRRQNRNSVLPNIASIFFRTKSETQLLLFNRICNTRIGRTLFQLCHAYVITKSQKKTESKFCPPEHR